MKISILGTNGFLSTSIGKYVNQKGWELNAYGLEVPKEHSCTKFFKANLVSEELDYPTLLHSDMIIYAIGAGIQSNLHEKPDLIYNLNVTVPVSICNKLKELDYKGTFISFGSYFEMGKTKEERPFSENDILTSTCTAPNDYTVSKRMFSRFVTSYKHDFTHWHFILPTIYGEGENPVRLIPYTINAIMNNDKLHFTEGNQVRQYIHVCEIPKIIDLSYSHSLPSGIYNAEGKDILSVREIVSLILDYFNVKNAGCCFGEADRADVGMKYLALDGTRLSNFIGFHPQIGIIQTIPSYQRKKEKETRR